MILHSHNFIIVICFVAIIFIILMNTIVTAISIVETVIIHIQVVVLLS